MTLGEIRKEIDGLDEQLVELLVKRMNCSKEVALIKSREGLGIFHAGREQEILNKVTELGGEYGTYIAGVYGSLMDASRELQHGLLHSGTEFNNLLETAQKQLHVTGTLACQGAEGAYSHRAAKLQYPNAEIKFYHSFEDVFMAVENGEAEFGFVPVENSTAGSVSKVYDLILKYRHYIVGAVSMNINHCLLGCKNSSLNTVKTVYSHEQALLQCADYIEQHGFLSVGYGNTATAASMVAQKCDPTIAAISSEETAELYGLQILEKNIQSLDSNTTRFITLSKQLIIPENSNKVSLVFVTPHSPGALQRTLTRFALHGLNLTKLESRAAKNGDFESQFYLDFLGNAENPDTVSLLSALSDELIDFAFLGNYIETKIEN